MVREIKFRGKRVDNGEWVYGYPVFVCGECFIVLCQEDADPDACYTALGQHDVDYHAVDPETVGQFIGFQDLLPEPTK